MININFKITRKDGFYEITDSLNNIVILTKKYSFGRNIIWEKDIRICNRASNPMEELIIEDNIFIGSNTTVMLPSLEICDYTKINNHFYAHGTNPLKIGYNCWIGSAVILDTLGGLKIGNNVGIGNQTQIYSHAKFGDTLYGCRINSLTSVSVGDDVWIAPNSTITSASMAKKSMLLAGSVLTKDTIENHVYGGVPAEDVTDKIGVQFDTRLDYDEMYKKLNQYLVDFYNINPQYKSLDLIKIERVLPKKLDKKYSYAYSYFSVKDRRYTKRGTDTEAAFIKFLLPEKAKFTPK